MDDSIHRGHHVHWKQHESSTQTVNGITGHSDMPVEEDFASSEVRIHTRYIKCVTVVLPMPKTLCLSHSGLEFLKQNSLTESLPILIPPLKFVCLTLQAMGKFRHSLQFDLKVNKPLGFLLGQEHYMAHVSVTTLSV